MEKVKEYLIAILIVIILILGSMFMIQRSTIKDTSRVLANTEQEVKYWKDATGRYRAKVEDVVMDSKVFKITQQALIDSLKTEGIKGKVVYVAGTETVVRDTISIQLQDTIIVRDGPSRPFEYRDDWTFIQGAVFPDRVDLSYSVQNEIKLVSYKKGFIKRKTYVEAISMNPRAEITGMKSLRVEDKRRFGVGPQLGVTYMNGSITPYLGIGLSWNLIRF